MSPLGFLATVFAVLLGNLLYDIGNTLFDSLLGSDKDEGTS